MKKPTDLGTKLESTGFVKLKPGGHKMIIKNFAETQSSTGKDMVVLTLDTCPDDIQPYYFKQLFDNQQDGKKKWNRAGMDYIVEYTASGEIMGKYDKFLNAVEKSNGGQQIPWGASSAELLNFFIGKVVGVVYRERENLYNGKIYTNAEISAYCPVGELKNQPVPEKITLTNIPTAGYSTPSYGDSNGFSTLADDMEELPFA